MPALGIQDAILAEPRAERKRRQSSLVYQFESKRDTGWPFLM